METAAILRLKTDGTHELRVVRPKQMQSDRLNH